MRRSVALITGAGRGLGRGIAEAFASAGWSVVLNFAGNVEAASEALRVCRERASHEDQRFMTVKADISVSTDRDRLLDEAWKASDGVDVLVNNAGIAPRKRLDILESEEDSFESLIRTNLQGPYFLTQSFAKRVLRGDRAGKSIIFVTSVSAEVASVTRGEYCVSKAGLSMAAKLWATRLGAEGIPVFEVRPGIMATDMTAAVKEKYDSLIEQGLVPAARWGSPDDVGKAVVSLASGAWSYSTGSIINVDGGLHIPKL